MLETPSDDYEDGWETPSKMARPLRAPQPDVSTPLGPVPSLSAPQPKEATPTKPLCAPQPFSNAPEADVDGTERRFKRTARVSNSGSRHRRKSGSSNASNKKRSSKRIHRDRRQSNSGRKSKASPKSSNTMEPEHDSGAQPLHGNAIRKPSFIASMAEASNVPYASVALVGSISTAKTATETSFDHSSISNNAPLHNNNSSNSSSNQETIARQKPYPRKYPSLSRISKTSFTGDIATVSRTRVASSTDTDEANNNAQQGRISTSARISMSGRSGTSTEDRFSSTSFSMDMGYPGSRESREFSIVANVVDEAQLEAEFAERMKSRIVEAVEIRPSLTGDEENPRISNTYSYTNNRISNAHSNSHSGSGIHESSSNHENSSHHDSDGNDEEEPQREKKPRPSRDLIHCMQQKRTIRCVASWTGFFVAIIILVVVLVVFLRVSRSDR